MGVEPRIDALDMERMFAFWEEAEDLGLVEPGQADRALEPVLVTAERPEAENGQGLDDGAVNARVFTRGGSGGSGIGVSADDDESTALAVLGIEENKEEDGEDGGENADDYGYARPEGGGPGGARVVELRGMGR